MSYEEVQTISAFGIPYTEYRYYPEPTDLEIPIITIEFKPKTHPLDDYCYDQPQFVLLMSSFSALNGSIVNSIS
ncbi:MAG: hypothetical protein HC820_08245 [Hydrococcus sp. RM1_1_31]|nr:hypothetical protein [Hydrococcus sp. RM1_1_31]